MIGHFGRHQFTASCKVQMTLMALNTGTQACTQKHKEHTEKEVTVGASPAALSGLLLSITILCWMYTLKALPFPMPHHTFSHIFIHSSFTSLKKVDMLLTVAELLE